MSITDTNNTSTECVTEPESPLEDAPEDEDGEALSSSSSRVSTPIRVIPATDAQPLVTIPCLL